MGRGTKQSDSIRSFTGIASLLNTNAAQAEKVENDDDDIHQIVWDIMADFKGRTVAEVVLRVKNADFNKADVLDALNLLCVKGCFNKSSNTNPIYSMKAGATMPKVTSASRVKDVEKKDAVAHGLVSMDQMTLFEKMDWYIWNLMKDRSWRGANDIAKSIVNHEISRNVAHGRVESLYRGNWFQRRGTGSHTVYQIRGNVPEPTAKAASSIPAEVVAEFDQADVVTPAPREVSMAPPKPQPIPTTLSNAVRPQPIPAPVVSHLTPTLDDGVNTCIWKVMQDYGEYTVNDLATLLADVGILYANISGRMSVLHQIGWFERHLASTAGNAPFLYKLKKDIPMPVDEAKFQGAERLRLLKLRDKPAPIRITKADLKPEDTSPTAMELALQGVSALQDVVGKVVEVAAPAQVQKEEVQPESTVKVNASLTAALSGLMPDADRKKLENLAAEATSQYADRNPLGASTSHDTSSIERAIIKSVVDPDRIFAHRVKEAEVKSPATQPKKETEQMNIADTAAPEAQITGPMVEVKVTIKGAPFTMKEARTLMSEIVSLGYSSPATVKDHSARLIQTSITIKGQTFSPADLLTVHRELVAQGLGASA